MAAALSACLLGVIAPAAIVHAEAPRPDTPAVIHGRPVRISSSSQPWAGTVALLVDDEAAAYDAHACGGVLVAPDVVLTAAHCVKDGPGRFVPPTRIEVTAVRELSVTGRPRARVGVAEAFVHPHYRLVDGVPVRDVAVLRLSHALSGPVAQRATSADAATWIGGATGTIAGWGTTEVDADVGPRLLHQARVPVPDQAVCSRDDAGGLGSVFDADSMVCAGQLDGERHDTCQGDSGGPLFVDTPTGPRLVAVTSAGRGCASGTYGVYARIDNLSEWIDHVARTPLPAPRGARMVDPRRYDQVSAAWEPVAGAVRYAVWMRSVAFDADLVGFYERDRFVGIVPAPRIAVAVAPRRSGSTRLVVRAIESDGTRGASTLLDVAPRLDQHPPSVVRGVRVLERGDGSLRVAWRTARDGESGVARYDVERRTGSGWVAIRRTQHEAVVIPRAPRASVQVRVRAYDRAGNAGRPSPVVVLAPSGG